VRDSLTLLFGKPWTGKTERMLHELREEPRVVLVDPKCSQLVRLRGWEHIWPEVSLDVGSAGGRFWIDDRVLRSLSPSKPFRTIVHFRNFHRIQLELLSRIAMWVKNCVVAIDELSLFVPPGPAGALPPNITSVVVSGSHDGLRIIGTSQRPSLVHGTLRANANRILMYRVTEPADVEALRAYLPLDFRDVLPRLPDFVCVDWHDGRPCFVDYSLRGKLHSLPGIRA
jgi:hypothetical protein